MFDSDLDELSIQTYGDFIRSFVVIEGGTAWIVLSICIGFWAGSLSRNAVGWGVCSFLFSPMLVGLILALCGEYEEEK